MVVTSQPREAKVEAETQFRVLTTKEVELPTLESPNVHISALRPTSRWRHTNPGDSVPRLCACVEK